MPDVKPGTPGDGRHDPAAEPVTPLVEEIDYGDPALAFAAFADDACATLLDSASTGHAQGRYSYIAPAPFATITSKDGRVATADGTRAADPFAALRAALAPWTLAKVPGLPPFQGGATGWFGYELAQHLERVPLPADDMGFPDLGIGLHDVVVAYDHHARRAWIL